MKAWTASVGDLQEKLWGALEGPWGSGTTEKTWNRELEDNSQDYWLHDGTKHVRVFRKPRKHLFTPDSVAGGPPVTKLKTTRKTCVYYTPDEKVVHQDEWTNEQVAHEFMGDQLWTGYCVFYEKSAKDIQREIAAYDTIGDDDGPDYCVNCGSTVWESTGRRDGAKVCSLYVRNSN